MSAAQQLLSAARPAGLAAGTQLRADNFNRTDSASVIGAPSDGGSAWVIGGGTWGIDGNRLYRTTAATSEDHIWVECGQSDYTYTIDVGWTGNSGPCFPSMIVRLVDNANFILVNIDYSTGVAHIYSSVAGAINQIATGTTPSGWVQGNQPTTYKVVCAGTSITVTATNADIGTNIAIVNMTTSLFQTATKAGMRCSDANTFAHWDNFLVKT